MNVSKETCMYVCAYVRMYVCVCMYVCMYICMYVFMYVCVYVCMYVCMRDCVVALHLQNTSQAAEVCRKSKAVGCRPFGTSSQDKPCEDSRKMQEGVQQ